MNLPVRKHPRLKDYDYGQCGCYHITICTKDRRPILSKIIPSSHPTERAKVQLMPQGELTDQYIRNIPKVYHDVHIIKYAIMPNHVHLLFALETSASVTVPTMIRSLKRMVTRELGFGIWQESYYDVVIRNDTMFQCEWNYIDTNPDKWAEDALFVSSL